jgi:tellurite resistance protein TerC
MQPETWQWLVFAASMAVLLALDLFLHRGGRETSSKAALIWSVVWIAAGLLFSLVLFASSKAAGNQYLAAYAMEKSLSLDNMFVFLLIFRSLNIPSENQHTALSWGILGALVFRALFVVLGVSTLERWDWVRYVFGAILLAAAVHAFRSPPSGEEPRVVKWLSQRFRVTRDGNSNKFIKHDNGKAHVTPLFLALVAIEVTDVAFAVDSVPAALSITRDRFVVYSSNAFAIVGLRAIYLGLHGYLLRLRYLHYGLTLVLVFAAVKIMIDIHVHPLVSVGIIVVCIGTATITSLMAEPRTGGAHAEHGLEADRST